MMQQYTYFLVLAASLAGPLLLSFDKKVHFYKKWKFLFPAMLLPAIAYILWDIWFTHAGIWSFNPRYISGIKIVNLPLEEVLFFFVIPYCCVFIYECMRCYFPQILKPSPDKWLLPAGIILILIATLYHQRLYTFTTFGFCGIFLLLVYLYKARFPGFPVAAVVYSYLVVLIPFLLINGLLTAIPVVLYNDAENMRVRLYTIPAEDIFYGLLLFMWNVAGYEKRRAAARA